METNLEIAKRFLSISLKELSKNNIQGMNICEFYDGNHQWSEDSTLRYYLKKNKSPFTGLIILSDKHWDKDDDKNLVESKYLVLKGLKLGGEIFASTYRSSFCGTHHGLAICNDYQYKNIKGTAEDNIRGWGITSKPILPESYCLSIFGIRINEWERLDIINNQKYYSHKFLEDFLLVNLNKKNIIKNMETSKKDLHRNILTLIKKINNFESFLNDEMNFLKEEFKEHIKIKSIKDCINLIFIFNPMFREVVEAEFENHYIFNTRQFEKTKKEKTIEKTIKDSRNNVKKQESDFNSQIQQSKLF